MRRNPGRRSPVGSWVVGQVQAGAARRAAPEPPAEAVQPQAPPRAADARAADAERRPGEWGPGGSERGQGRGPAEATRGFKYGSRARAHGTARATAASRDSPSPGSLPRGARAGTTAAVWLLAATPEIPINMQELRKAE